MGKFLFSKELIVLSDLIQVSIGNRVCLSFNPSPEEWRTVYAQCQAQTIAGVVFTALEKLSSHAIKPPTDVLFEWIGLSEQIKQQNILINRRCFEISNMLAKAGFRCCILKGQGNARMYVNPLSRTPGDIDVWVEGERESIRDFVMSRCPNSVDGIMHIEFPVFNDAVVEVHYLPRHSIVPKYNRRILSWLYDISNEQFSNFVEIVSSNEETMAVPTTKFNVVYQMSHMLGHMLAEGIGMRHIIDYYYVLKALNNEGRSDNYEQQLDYLGMLHFAKGIMWIEEMICGMNKEWAIVSPSEETGRLILLDVLDGGNFGRSRVNRADRNNGILRRVLVDTTRLFRLFRVQPSQAIWRLAHKFTNVDSAKQLLLQK